MTTLLQISDLHFGTERAEVVEALARFSAEQRPDVLLLSGDITQRARPAEFEAASAFVSRLGAPAVLAIPGNHDIPLFDPFARLFWPYRNYARAFGNTLEPWLEREDLLVLGVRTTRRYRHKHGEVSAAQIERVAGRLRQARPGQWRVVAVHQPVAVTRESDRVNLLRGHARAVARWAQAGADLVVGGHIHLPFIVPLRERWPALARPVWAVQAGTAVSARVRAGVGNSVNLIRAGRDCRIERWDHDGATGRFTLVGSLTLDPRSAGPAAAGASEPAPG